MRKVIVSEWMSLDGVVQAPAYANEDPSGGFKHGGWHLRYFEDISMKWVVENVTQAGAGACPTHEHAPKEPLGWQNSRLLEGDVAAAVAALKREDGKYLLAIGSTELVQTLIAHNLANEFRMMIDPVVLGGGKRVFDDDGVLKSLRLVSSEVTATGAILATYARAAS